MAKPKILVHNPGMISIDADSSNIDDDTLAALKETKLFKSVAERIGEKSAIEIIKKPRI